MRRLLATLLAVLAPAAGAQVTVEVVDRGPGGSGRAIETALAKPHRVILPDSGWYRMRRGERSPVSLVVLGRTAAIEGDVDGDVVVVDGDLFVRPGGRIAGRAVAIGGGVYPSALAIVEGGTESHRDNTFSITQQDGAYRLAYVSLREDASPPLLLPGVFGLRMPSYDRANGASVRFGPALSLFGGLGEVDALLTYRSDLGKVDPSVRGSMQFTRRLRAEAFAGRGTFSNDDWIWSNFVNSFSVLVWGEDTRNYYRADRAEGTLHHLWETTRWQVEPFAGGRVERAWEVGPAPGETRGPWSVFGRTDSLGMWRPNPAVPRENDIASALAGARLRYELVDELLVRARVRGELGSPSNGPVFLQLVTDADARFPTFGEQEYSIDVHWVSTPTAAPPAQRFVYLGGAGTLPFLDLLSQGGDQALLIDQRYSIPVPSVRLGLLGEPTIIFRHRMGSAGLGRLPAFEQVVGAGVMLAILRVELQMDPIRRKARLSTGFSFSR